MSQPIDVIPGAEARSWPGGPHGVLVVHGFTGNPSSLVDLAEAFAGAGYAVELPRLPGHGTTIEDMITTGWGDWTGALEEAYLGLAARCDKVVVAGLSMGGALTCWLATRHQEIAGIVVVNPVVEPVAESFLELLTTTLDQGVDRIPGIGSDIAKPGVTESAYLGTPIAPAISMYGGIAEMAPHLAEIQCPVLLFNSPQDHVVPPTSSDLLEASVSGPIERVTLARSFHVATLDYDKDEIESRAVEFVLKVTAG